MNFKRNKENKMNWPKLLWKQIIFLSRKFDLINFEPGKEEVTDQKDFLKLNFFEANEILFQQILSTLFD